MTRYVLCVWLLIFVGCGSNARYYSTAEDANVTDASVTPTNGPKTDSSGGNERVDDASDSDIDLSRVDPNKTAERKIIYTATIELVVDSVRDLDATIKGKIKEHKAYISQYRENRVYGDRLQGHWVLRVPSDRFQDFLDILVQSGVAKDQQINAQDVTEEYVDLDRRLVNKKRLEERILKLLDEHAGAIKDVIEVETQLARVREDIERMEGRLRYLRDHVAMTTITITALEDEDYTPPKAPGFATQISDTFGDSIDSLASVGKASVLFVVGASPWLVLIFIFGFATLIGFRRRRNP